MIYDDRTEEMVPLAGDGDPTRTGIVSQSTRSRDPNGTGAVGASSGVQLDKTKDATVVIRYKDRLIEADVYAFPGAPIKLVLLCPRCGNALNVESDKKQMSFEKHAPHAVGDFINMGRLNVEPFECTWELPDAGVHVPGLVSAGTSLCRWRVGISNNIARDA